jgi:hypothetical protein
MMLLCKKDRNRIFGSLVGPMSQGDVDAGLCAAHQEMYRMSVDTEFRDMWHV